MQHKNVFAVISNFNADPTPVTKLFESFVVYDQSSDRSWLTNVPSRNLKFTKHVGHNLIDYFDYILGNFENLPEWICLAKGNMLSRHITLEEFNHALQEKNSPVVPLFSKLNTRIGRISYIDSSGWFNEKNVDWYVRFRRHRYFVSLDDFCDFFFVEPPKMKWIPFSPGACYLVEGKAIEIVGREIFQALRELLTYDFFPSEAWMVERVLGLVLRNDLQLKPNLRNLYVLKQNLHNLPDLSDKQVPGGEFSKFLQALRKAKSRVWRL